MARKPVVADIIEPTGPVVATRLIGHGEAEQTFLRALERNRMPHAWLICGPRGVGKATLAYRMARRLLSEMPPQEKPEADNFALFDDAPAMNAPSPSGQGIAADNLDMPADHPVFRRIVAQSHPDIRVLQRRVNEKTGKLRSEILIEDVRDVLDFLHLKPAESHWRVVIIDAADDLNRNAANAILKMLEEPAARTVLILVSHAPGSLLPTIRSRCSPRKTRTRRRRPSSRRLKARSRIPRPARLWSPCSARSRWTLFPRSISRSRPERST